MEPSDLAWLEKRLSVRAAAEREERGRASPSCSQPFEEPSASLRQSLSWLSSKAAEAEAAEKEAEVDAAVKRALTRAKSEMQGSAAAGGVPPHTLV